jgi:Terminase small subunit
MSQPRQEVGCEFSLLTARQQGLFGASKSDEVSACEQARIQLFVEAKRSDLRNGLTRRQRTFVLEKLVGLNDKDAALAAGYSMSVAENTKQRVWKPQVRAEWERLRCDLTTEIEKEIAARK